MRMMIFTEKEIRSCVGLDLEAVRVIEEAFTDLAVSKVITPPIMRIDIEESNGEVDIKSAYVAGKPFFAIKVSSGFFDNYKLGLPSANGLMMIVSTVTGEPEALFLDNGYLTEVRTAAAGAVAAKHLAKEEVQAVGIIGTGAQARYQLRALQLVRRFEQVLVYGRSPQKVQAFKEEVEKELGIEVTACSSPRQVVVSCDIVVTTTPAKDPIIKADWLHPGLHITAMGSDAEEKQELEAEVLNKADRIICDRKDQCLRLGELHHAVEQGDGKTADQAIELGEITAKRIEGRRSDKDITVCDLTGTGVQDTAIALYAYKWLKAQKTSGLIIENKKISFS